jgi:replicative DNA helicase
MTQANEKVEDNIPLEYQIFALSFRKNGAINYFKENLPEEIVGSIHGEKGINEFYKALLAFENATQLDTVDPIAFKSWLQTETDIHEALGGNAGVSVMVDLLMSVELSTQESVSELVKYKANKRKQINYLQELQSIISQKGQKTEDDISRIQTLTSEIRELENQIRYNPLDKITTADEIASRVDSLLDIPNFLPTQFKALNRAMGYTDEGGFFRGAVHAVIAASGKGKSTFVKCLANNWLDNGYRVLYVNFEEATGHWERILMTQIIEKNVYLESSKWSEEEKNKHLNTFKARLAKWGDRLMVRHDPDTPYFEDLEFWLRDIIGQNINMPDIVIIDTIQSMFTKGGGKGKPRWGEFEEMMVRLEKLARDMNCALIITAQENSNRMKEKREVVQQSDTGGSLAIQQKCAVTIFITEKRLATNDETEDENIMQLQIPKNRITGSAFLYDPPLVKYVDYKKTYEDYDPVTDSSYTSSSSLLDDLLSGKDFH